MNTDNMVEQEVIVNGNNYLIGIDDFNVPYAKKYNDKYKVWLIIRFSLLVNESAVKDILNTLKNDYIERQVVA